MLVPQFSIRWLLVVTMIAAVIFSIIALGMRGHHWATAVSAGLLALTISVGFYGLLFFVAWVFSEIATRCMQPRGDSPFLSALNQAEAPATPILLEPASRLGEGSHVDPE